MLQVIAKHTRAMELLYSLFCITTYTKKILPYGVRPYNFKGSHTLQITTKQQHEKATKLQHMPCPSMLTV